MEEEAKLFRALSDDRPKTMGFNYREVDFNWSSGKNS